MKEKYAEQIAKLLNERNGLVSEYTTEKILNKASEYLFEVDDNDQVIAAIRTRRVQWYQAEIRHLVIHPSYEKRGFGKRMILLAENSSRDRGLNFVQCTIREDNIPARSLFEKCQYQMVNSFVYKKSKHTLTIWQKVLQ